MNDKIESRKMFVVYDERATTDTERAVAMYCANSLDEARKDLHEDQVPGVIYEYDLVDGQLINEKFIEHISLEDLASPSRTNESLVREIDSLKAQLGSQRLGNEFMGEGLERRLEEVRKSQKIITGMLADDKTLREESAREAAMFLEYLEKEGCL